MVIDSIYSPGPSPPKWRASIHMAIRILRVLGPMSGDVHDTSRADYDDVVSEEVFQYACCTFGAIGPNEKGDV